MVQMLPTVNKVCQRQCTRKEGSLELMLLCLKLSGEQKIVTSYVGFFFPMHDLGEVVMEDDLKKSRFNLPVLQALFDDLDGELLIFFFKN